MLTIRQIPVLTDNYIYLIHDQLSEKTAVVDPALVDPVLSELSNSGWSLDYILNTHHHADHVGGNLGLKSETGCTIVGSRSDAKRIPGIDIELGEGDIFELGESVAKVLAVSGHTIGHIAYWFGVDDALFCGDTLFALGCGRLFEGSAEQMWKSLGKLKTLPGATRVYCAHEYTQANGRFALTVDPKNILLAERMERVNQLRQDGAPTVPSTLADEFLTNPFLRADTPELRATSELPDASPQTVFAEIRRRKDRF